MAKLHRDYVFLLTDNSNRNAKKCKNCYGIILATVKHTEYSVLCLFNKSYDARQKPLRLFSVTHFRIFGISGMFPVKLEEKSISHSTKNRSRHLNYVLFCSLSGSSNCFLLRRFSHTKMTEHSTMTSMQMPRNGHNAAYLSIREQRV